VVGVVFWDRPHDVSRHVLDRVLGLIEDRGDQRIV
jgi:hypothetical protein